MIILKNLKIQEIQLFEDKDKETNIQKKNNKLSLRVVR